MKKNIKSELILESAKELKKVSGFFKETKTHTRNIFETKINVSSEEISKKIGREMGSYITFNFDDLLFFDIKAKKELESLISKSILAILRDKKLSVKRLLVIGLGNEK